MGKRILLVDDSPEDRELYKRFLKKGQGDDITLFEAETGEEALSLFKGNDLDLVIIDYHLPDYNGINLLTALPRKNGRPVVPAIMVTGQGNESVAVDAMKKGVKDYVMKGNITAGIFNKTVRNVLKEAETERALDESRAFIDTLIHTTPNPLFYKDMEGKYLGCNPAFEKMLGVSLSRIIGKTACEFADNAFASHCEEMDRILLETGESQQYIVQFRPAGDDEKFLIFNKSVFNDTKGRIAGIVGVITDITQNKKAEAELLLEKNKLEAAMMELKKLSGLLPICSNCKKIRDEKGYWTRVEAYIQEHSEAVFTHGICEECVKKLYPDLDMDES